MKIKIINPIWSKCINPKDIDLLKKELQYPAVFWRQGQYRKERKEYTKFLIDKNGMFLTGFIPRIQEFCLNNNIHSELDYSPINLPYIYPKLDGIELQNHQIEAVNSILENRRGVIKLPTASGKSFVFLAIIKAYDTNSLILVNNKDLLYQNYNEAKKFFPDVGLIGDGHMEPDKIAIGMIQTFSKLELSEYHKKLDIVIIEEAHHCQSLEGIYYEALTKIPAQIRIGVTATLPIEKSALMAMEGLLGPVIYSGNVKQMTESNLLAKVRLQVIKTPYSHTVHELRKYSEVYEKGVVQNKDRHNLIIDKVNDLVSEGKTVLMIIVKVEHGKSLIELLKKKYPNIKSEFVWGDSESDLRNQVKKDLSNKTMDVVIASTIFKEGINIPSLGAIINAAGGKSEIQTLQILGRGVRATADKDEIILVDIFDPSHNYLISHFGSRISAYSEEKWI